MSIDWGMDKENVGYLLHGILLSYEKEWTLTTYNQIVGVGDHYAQWIKPIPKGQMSHFCSNIKQPASPKQNKTNINIMFFYNWTKVEHQ